MKWLVVVAALFTSNAIGADTKLVPIIPAGGLQIQYANQLKNWITTQGTWVIIDATNDGERIADPINISKISCIKEEKQCREMFAYIYDNKKLDVDEILWTIDSWKNNEVVASDEAMCRSVSLTINISTQEVIKVVRNGGSIPKECAELGPKIGLKPLPKPVVSKLMNPYDAMRIDPRTAPAK